MAGGMKIKFRVLHAGRHWRCIAWMRHGTVGALALDNDEGGQVRVLRDLSSYGEPQSVERDWRGEREELQKKLGVLTDFLHSGMKWELLTSMRNAPNLWGAIIDAVEDRRLEAERAERLLHVKHRS